MLSALIASTYVISIVIIHCIHYCVAIYVTESANTMQSYLHVKFDLILSLSNLITLFPNIVLYQKFYHTHKIS